MRKKIYCILISFILMAEVVVPVRATTISGVKKEQEKTQKTLENVKDQIDVIETDKEAVSAELEQLSDQLVDILTSIEICQDEIAVKKKEIEQAKLDLADAKEQEQTQYDNMKKRIKFMYEQGDKAYVQVLLESADYSDMVNKADYIEKLYNYDRELLANYVAVKEQVEQLGIKLEDEEADLEASNRELEQEQEVLQTLVDEKKKTVADFDAQLSAARQKAATYKKQLEEQTAQIKKLEEEAAAKKKKEEEAAKKKAEEEAAKKKAETENTDIAADDATDSPEQSDDAVPSEPDSLTAGAGTVTDTSASGTGQQVANYACQFVGNPYVFGGTSLTSGTDCSGFTQAVYAHFGISIPRDSYSQRSAGTAVDYSSARAGDIICYAGHVALYLGNGQIVHASTERTGITYGYATYRTILAVRRIV